MTDGLPAKLHEEFLTCKICYEAFQQPKILTCLHSFCASCLEKHLLHQYKVEEQNRAAGNEAAVAAASEPQQLLPQVLQCPLCRQPTELAHITDEALNSSQSQTPPPESTSDTSNEEDPHQHCKEQIHMVVDNLKDNFFLASLADAVVVDVPLCDSCNERGEQRGPVVRCRECNENLCDDCLHAHQRLTLTKNHSLVPFQQGQNQPAAAPEVRDEEAPSHKACQSFMTCRQHPHEESKLYCQQCTVPVCVTCKLTNHEGHPCCSLPEAASHEKERLNKLLDVVSSRTGEYEKILEDWRKYQNNLDRQQLVMQAKIDKRREELASLVSGWHYATSQQLKATYSAEKKHIAAKIDMVDVQLDTHRGVCALATDILQQAPQQQVLRLREQIHSDVSNLQRHNLNALCLTQKSILSFNVGGQSLNFDHFGSFILSHEKVVSSVRVKPEQHITLLAEFNSRNNPVVNGNSSKEMGSDKAKARFDTSSIAVTADGMIVVADRQLDRVGLFTMKGELHTALPTAVLGKPICAMASTSGDILFSRDKHSICIYTNQGKYKKTLKDNLSKPCGICIGPENVIYIFDYQTKTVTKYDEDMNRIGHVKLSYSNKSNMWDRIAVNSQGNLFLLCSADNCLLEFTCTGERLSTLGRWGSSPGDVYWPRGVCVDGHDNILIADTHNARVQLVSPHGTFTVLTPDHMFTAPTDVTVTKDGKLWVLEKNGIVKAFEYLPY